MTTFEEAVRPGAPQLHANVSGNLAFEFDSGDESTVAAAFARAKRVSKLTMESQRLVGNAMEPRACLVSFDAASGRYTFCPCRASAAWRPALARERSRQGKARHGDAGRRRQLWRARPGIPEYFAVMIAARKLGRPVKWVGTRAEIFRRFSGARDVADRRARHGCGWQDPRDPFRRSRDIGAYGAAFGPYIATQNITITIGGVYRSRRLARTRLAYTNTVPISAYRGAGRPESPTP